MAKVQVNSPALGQSLSYTTPEPLIVASRQGVFLDLEAEPDIVRLALSWPEVSDVVKKELDKLPALLERKVS